MQEDQIQFQQHQTNEILDNQQVFRTGGDINEDKKQASS
jgi:hypothetical protein